MFDRKLYLVKEVPYITVMNYTMNALVCYRFSSSMSRSVLVIPIFLTDDTFDSSFGSKQMEFH